ncbi:MAG: LysM peptidoglycan-binding domain-containing protein [Nitrospirota bacterium]
MMKRDLKALFLFLIFVVLTVLIPEISCADTTYVIRKGDNPSSIAKKFKVKAKDIVKMNNLDPRSLRPGKKIIIPCREDPTKTKNSLNGKNDIRNRNTKEPEGNSSSTHVVRKGETLSYLSKKYSISVRELRELNNLRSSKIRTGQELIVRKNRPKIYTVQKGDSVYKIARKFDISMDELKDINDLHTDLLKPGQEILLKPSTNIKAENEDLAVSRVNPEEIKDFAESWKTEETSLREKIVLIAEKLLNIPYRFGGNSLLGIDCSAFVQRVYGLIGIDLPRSAREQFEEGDPVDRGELSIGDLVFFRTYAPFPSHVGIYLGNNMFIHASSKSKKVTIDSLETPYYFKRFIGAKRLLDTTDIVEFPRTEG